MNRETVHAEGVKCVKEVEQYIIGLQTCPEDLREHYVFQIVNTVVRNAFRYFWSTKCDDSLADALCDYEEIYRWVREHMVREGCVWYPHHGEYMRFIHVIGKTLANL